MKKVYLSPSGQTANSYTGIATTEAEQMQKVGAIVQAQLERHGIQVIVANPKLGVSLRGKEANSLGVDAYVAIHSNAGGGHGTEAYYDPNSEPSKQLTKAIYDRVAAITPTSDRSTKNGMATFGGAGYAEIRVPQLPAAETLVEVEFHDNPAGATWIVNNIQQLGIAITKGILEYLGIAWIDESAAVPTQTTSKIYKLQFGAFSNKSNAEKMQAELKSKGYQTIIV